MNNLCEKGSRCVLDTEIGRHFLNIGERSIWVCPSCQAKVVMAGQDAGKILKDLPPGIALEAEDKKTENTQKYEIYYRDYKEGKAIFLGTLMERRWNPEREKSMASVLRWARIVFKGAFKDPNALFAVKKGRTEQGVEVGRRAKTMPTCDRLG